MSTPRIGQLTHEDLARWRLVSANKELVDQQHAGYSVAESRQAILDYYITLGDLMKVYEIDTQETLIVSPIDGGIYKVDNAFGL